MPNILVVFCFLSLIVPNDLLGLDNSEVLNADSAGSDQDGAKDNNLKKRWQGWSLIAEGGSHFKTLPGANFSGVKSSLGHDKRYWGELGVFGGLGFKYSRTFKAQWYWDIKAMWSYFYPDIRWEGRSSEITLGSIPFIGKYINLGTLPGYWTMILIPVLYFDVGYITKSGILFALGSAYVWGLSPSVTIPFDDHWSMELRSTVFLDRLFFDVGYHNFLTGLSINYKF